MKKKTVTLFTILFVYFNIHATNYYVSNTGNDNKNGLSKQTPWKTIAKVNETTFQPGDSILFERGGTWREQLVIQQSGNSNNYIVYAAYGTGDKPQILGSERVETWTEIQSNIWKSDNEVSAPRERTGNSVTNHPASIFFVANNGDVTWGNMENLHLNSEGAPKDICECSRDNGFNLMDEEYDWCWDDNYVYVYSTQNPANRYSYVEVPQRSAAIKMNSHNARNYIKIENLELLYALKYGFDGGWPMAYEKRGLEIKNCHIGYMGTKGAASAIGIQLWHSDVLIQGNDIHDCGRRNISYNVYGDTRTSSLVFENVTFDNNKLHNGYHTTGIDINGGYSDEFRNFVIKNNMIWDNPADDPENKPNDFSSMGLFLNSNQATFTGFKVYNNVFSFIKQKHISANALKNSFIAHNTFYGMNLRAGGSGYRQMILVTNSPENFKIDNNLFYGNVNDEYVLSAVTYANSSETGTSMNNNFYYQQYPNQRMVTINSNNKSYKMANWNDYVSETGWDTESPAPSDPNFKNAPNDLSLQSGSPVIGKGVYYAEITTDILGNARSSTNPSIGAYEYATSSSLEFFDSGEFIIYPNPAKDKIRINNNTGKTIKAFSLFDITGNIILSKSLANQVGEIDISNLTKGVYVIKIQVEEEMHNSILIKN
jgi:hypothetical protein